ncbi:MAG: transposase, partial [Acidimicrobiales bacterium]
DALWAALGRPGSLAGATFRSDHGCQYTSAEPKQACGTLGITQSMGSVGDSYDNAMAEALWSSLKRELVDIVHSRTIAGARAAVPGWEIWHNRERLHSSLGYLTPEEPEDSVLQYSKAA